MKNDGFTLAEVLITLGIIGVVAALTIPTLIQNHKKQTTVTQLKKAYSEISQALQFAQVDNGMQETWDLYSGFDGVNSASIYFAENYFFPYMKILKICNPTSSDCFNSDNMQSGHLNIISAITNSGYSFLTWVYYNPNNVGGWVVVDIDGPNKGKNKEGIDIFPIKFVYNASTDSANKSVRKGVYLSGLQFLVQKSRDELKEGNYCGALIVIDGWKISEDNPCW